MLYLFQDVGMEQELSISGPFTILAPLNAAFEALPDEDLKELQSSRFHQEKLVRGHILYGKFCNFYVCV